STPSGSVPTVVSGNTLSVKNGSTTILTGMFSAPPTPTPTVPVTRFFAPLTGPAISGMIPRGLGEYEAQGADKELEVLVSFVNLPEGTVLSVSVGSPAVNTGNIRLHNHARERELESE